MIGRKEEITILDDCLESNRPEFMAIYGRRRVGKTFLVKEYFNDTFSFYATGVYKCNMKQQLRIFKEALAKYGDSDRTVPADWFEAFTRLEKILEKESAKRDYRSGKRIVFLDEIPWMDTPRSNFKSALDYFWNSWGSSQKDLILIVCGSATSWVMDHLVKDTGGFYNRLTRQMRLLPFNLKECEELLNANGCNMTRKQVVESMMIFGGIPYYLNYLKPQFSLAQNVEKLFFQEDGPLKYEFHQLFSSLFQNSEMYVNIVKALSKRKSGLTRSELMKCKGVEGGKSLTRCLENLTQCGFIRSYRDFTRAKNGCFYQLIDPLTLFHLTFLETEDVDSWVEYIGTPGYHSWCGLAFERVCMLHTKQIKQALGISGIVSHEFAWKSKESDPGAQIDLLIDRKDDVINLCEIKYSAEEYVIDAAEERNLQHKSEVFRKETGTQKSLMLTMITFAGIKSNAHKNIVVRELTNGDLFD